MLMKFIFLDVFVNFFFLGAVKWVFRKNTYLNNFPFK